MADRNYTLGRGELYFARFKPGTRIPVGESYLGNTPEFSLTVEEESLDHFSSDRGIREKDDSVQLEVSRSGSFTADDIDTEKLALFFFGTNDILAVTTASVTDEALADVTPGKYYQLGVTTNRPTGVRNINPTGFSVSKGATPLTVTTDYIIENETGRLYLVPGGPGGVVDGDDLTVDYGVVAHSRERVISGSTPTEGQLRLVARNAKGKNFDYMFPWVKLSPNGDYSLKGDDWNAIPFSIEILRDIPKEAIYLDGRPYQPA